MTEHLTAKLINAAIKRGVPVTIRDHPRTGEPGLAVDVRTTGRAVFYWRRDVAGKTRRVPIGEFPAWSVAAARDRAHELNVKRASGRVPGKAPRLATFWTRYSEEHLPSLSPATQRAYLAAWDDLADLHHLRLDEITLADIAAVHTSLAAVPALANKVRAALSSILGRAMEWGVIEAMPRMPKQYKATKKRCLLSGADMKRLLAAVDRQPDPLPDLVRLVMFTGTRKAEACAARWADIDLATGRWAHGQKGGSEAVVVLHASLVVMLEKRKWRLESARKTKGSPWVFPSVRGGGHVVSPDKPWREARAAAGLPDLRLHDLRHNFVSWGTNLGLSLQLLSAQVGHADVATTEIYSHADIGPQAAAVNLLVGSMIEELA